MVVADAVHDEFVSLVNSHGLMEVMFPASLELMRGMPERVSFVNANWLVRTSKWSTVALRTTNVTCREFEIVVESLYQPQIGCVTADFERMVGKDGPNGSRSIPVVGDDSCSWGIDEQGSGTTAGAGRPLSPGVLEHVRNACRIASTISCVGLSMVKR